MVKLGRARDAAREIDQGAEHLLRDRGNEARARLRDEHARLARGEHIDIADVDRAAQESDQLRQALEDHRGSRGLTVGDDEVATLRGGDERLAFQRCRTFVQLHLAELAQPGERALAVVKRTRLG